MHRFALSFSPLSLSASTTTNANLKASQAKLKAMGRDLTLEEVYSLELDQEDN